MAKRIEGHTFLEASRELAETLQSQPLGTRFGPQEQEEISNVERISENLKWQPGRTAYFWKTVETNKVFLISRGILTKDEIPVLSIIYGQSLYFANSGVPAEFGEYLWLFIEEAVKRQEIEKEFKKTIAFDEKGFPKLPR